ncbi:MAG: hypothetical protein ISS01_02465 [Nanoarchaeota archaeon]|nr:hypothetical protein [Nanoarchaeota archaeon]
MQSLAKNKKGKLAPEQTAKLIIAVIVILSIVSIALFMKGTFDTDFFSQTACWLTNTAKCGGGFFSSFPSACRFNVAEEPLSMEEFSTVLTDTWWMYKEGTCDYGASVDETYFAYAFQPKEDIELKEYFSYSIEHKGGVETDAVHSAYNYLEQNTNYQTLCFDTLSEGIKDLKLSSNEYYYIIYYDDQDLIGKSEGDRILITTDRNFDPKSVDSIFETMAKIGISGTIAAYGVIFSFVIGPNALIIAGGAISFLFSDTGDQIGDSIIVENLVGEDPDDRGCLSYGPPLDSSYVS